MRYVKKQSKSPAILLSKAVKESLEEVIKDGTGKKVKSDLYRGLDEKGDKIIVEALLKLYHNKCAYCERFIGITSIEIEHYRPKGTYYWLCYEWTNLLPSCHYCNTFRFGKGTKFPIMSLKRQTIPKNKADYRAQSKYLRDEKPYLLHPEIDKPELFFLFTIEGKMEGVDIERRGEETIKVCNLNSFELKKDRKKECVDNLFNELSKILAAFDERKIEMNGVVFLLVKSFSDFQKKQNIEAKFSLMSKYVFENFETLIVPLFKHNKQKQILIHAYQLFCNGML